MMGKMVFKKKTHNLLLKTKTLGMVTVKHNRIHQFTTTFHPPVELYSGLLQRSERSVQFEMDSHASTHTTVTLRLPLCLLPSYWQYHSLSYTDLIKIIEFCPAQYTWLLALLYGINTSSSAIKPSFATINDILVSSKLNAITKIIKTLNFQFGLRDILDISSASIDHIPPLPCHSLPSTSQLANWLIPILSPFEMSTVEYIVYYRDKFWLPRSYEGFYLLCTRIVPNDDFLASGRYSGYGLACRPIRILYHNIIYALVEENILFYS